MSSFQAGIAAELPYLRRYARTLTGSQSVGDAAVRETLQAMIAAPDEIDEDAPVRTELYRIFHRIWSDSSLRPIEMPGAVVASLPRGLRKALHLKSLMVSMGNDVAAIVRTESEAIAAAEQVEPELILADVNLADGSSGIDAVRHILTTMTVPVIFITAFPEKLLTGDGHEPAYVISKPFNPDNVVATVWQALLVSRETAAMAEID